MDKHHNHLRKDKVYIILFHLHKVTNKVKVIHDITNHEID